MYLNQQQQIQGNWFGAESGGKGVAKGHIQMEQKADGGLPPAVVAQAHAIQTQASFHPLHGQALTIGTSASNPLIPWQHVINQNGHAFTHFQDTTMVETVSKQLSKKEDKAKKQQKKKQNRRTPGVMAKWSNHASASTSTTKAALAPKKSKAPRKSRKEGSKKTEAEAQEARSAMSGGGGGEKRRWSPTRKAVGFWAPFNDWWRLEYQKLGRRPATEEVSEWYRVHSSEVWQGEKPSIKETRRHAKCLRTTEDVRNYFRKYRAEKNSSKTQNICQGGRKPVQSVPTAKSPGSRKKQRKQPAAQSSPLPARSGLGVPGQMGSSLVAGFTPFIPPQQTAFEAPVPGAMHHLGPAYTQYVSTLLHNATNRVNSPAFRFAQQQQQSKLLSMHFKASAAHIAAGKVTSAKVVEAAKGSAPSTPTTGGHIHQSSAVDSPQSADTTEVIDRTASSRENLQVLGENECLSKMMAIIEKNRSLAVTPVHWKNSDGVAVVFQDDKMEVLENIKLEYEESPHALQLMPLLSSAESQGEHYIEEDCNVDDM
eukprot:CAMPEP_0198235356 /NCGR_PEP_ID=MMETSP1446-20131203/1262_1 /TAXON_ID=1461542 ORGANISM="Unidentified sp, Strain CCMP2111" /NCGR_SAMPLE_ID=MMETSP1446 /ASSEMBLY_ACC=CAM_ASM_001112 /LENGTH=538 /DNA_ID=CAMNT_0043916495 /DNA_START=386 /DNA_END=2002 /DNA_ORIENTATION=+